jgi:CubicO group peptidase (beta-lactamase class C family)
MKTIVSALLLLTFAVADADFEAIKEFQKSIIDDEITGSNVAMVFQDGEAIYYREQNSSKPGDKDVTPHTLFPIWSMSKPITIVAMMTLHEKGLVDFDDPVSKYIPQFEDLKCLGKDGIYDCVNELKIVHLMTHRSGYSYRFDLGHWQRSSTIKYHNLEEFVEDVAKTNLAFEPGQQFLYGISQAILGRVVEVITGKTFYEYLKETIFDPLGMTDTKFYLTEDERAKRFQPLFINSGNLKGFTFELNDLSYAKDNRAYFGGEGLVSTITDYSKFCQMLLNDGRFEGKKIISRKSIDIMTAKYSEGYPSEEHAPKNYLGFYIGFSLFVLEDPLIDGVGASKGIWGWAGYHNTHFWIDPEKNLFGLFMSRARHSHSDFQQQFRKAVYSSVN